MAGGVGEAGAVGEGEAVAVDVGTVFAGVPPWEVELGDATGASVAWAGSASAGPVSSVTVNMTAGIRNARRD